MSLESENEKANENTNDTLKQNEMKFFPMLKSETKHSVDKQFKLFYRICDSNLTNIRLICVRKSDNYVYDLNNSNVIL